MQVRSDRFLSVCLRSWRIYRYVVKSNAVAQRKSGLESLMDINKNQSIHTIGIGGIGTSSLARFYHTRGHRVSGSDLTRSEITDALAGEGISVAIGAHTAANIPRNTDVVIHTAATPKNNPELLAAKRRKIPAKTYAEALGDLTRHYRTITVSGSHGKSTTTALVALVLEAGYHDPTVIVGTLLKEFGGTNFRSGRSPYLVLEADEWNRSFLHYAPEVAIATNIDREHVDTYATPDELQEAFGQYFEKLPRRGKIIANEDDLLLRRVARKFGSQVLWYSRIHPEAALVRKHLKIPGEHNVSNALAALHLGRLFGVAEPQILKALSSYAGAWRRFEFTGMLNGAYLISDYGHHPNEIRATIAAARQRYPYRRIWCVYQPHQHRRTEYLWDDFVQSFDLADRVTMLPIYDVAGRETGSDGHSKTSAALVKELVRRGKDATHLPSIKTVKMHLCRHTQMGDVVLIMGAGDIYRLTKELEKVG